VRLQLHLSADSALPATDLQLSRKLLELSTTRRKNSLAASNTGVSGVKTGGAIHGFSGVRSWNLKYKATRQFESH
jgi:hypothetical protein